MNKLVKPYKNHWKKNGKKIRRIETEMILHRVGFIKRGSESGKIVPEGIQFCKAEC